MKRAAIFAGLVALILAVNVGAALSSHLGVSEARESFGAWVVGAADTVLVGVAWHTAGDLARLFGRRS